MKPNLDELKLEIPQQIESRGMTLFPGFSRVMDEVTMVFWNSKRNPDYREFLNAAEKTGAKVIVFYDREFPADLIEDAIERLQESDLPRDEQRSYERRLREMRVYDGFTCALELSFDLNGVVYLFELRTDWYEELNQILDEIEGSIPDDENDDDDTMGGYFSKN
jgi:hypothetical protein